MTGLSQQRIFTLLFLLFFCFHETVSGQLAKHGNIWHFGNRAGLDFSGGAPIPLSNVNMDSYEGCAVYCDADGEMLLYTNGGGTNAEGFGGNSIRDGIIWNKNQQVMYNMGLTEGGGYSAAQSALILPKPNSPDHYFVLTMDIGSDPTQPPFLINRGLSYFEVDMSANGGLGEVIEANVNLFKPSAEYLTAIPMSDFSGYWIIIVDSDSGDFVVIPLTEAGFGPAVIQPNIIHDQFGIVKASPNGKYICINQALYHFNATTGILTYKESIPISSYSLSFSPSSNYIYGFEDDVSVSLLRYDLRADSVALTQEVMNFDSIISFLGQMQIGPDGNIYLIEQLIEDIFNPIPPVSLTVIRCPDGLNPQMERSIHKYETDLSNSGGLFVSLPNFADYIFATSPITDTVEQSICTGNTVLDPGSGTGGHVWSTGATTAQITVNQAGTYIVSYQDACGFRVRTYLVDALQVDPGNYQQLATVCGNTPTELIPEGLGDVVAWSTGDTSATLNVTQAGEYTVQIINNCILRTVRFTVTKELAPMVLILPDVSIDSCFTLPIVLKTSVNALDNQWLWSTGATTASIQVDQYGIYAVTLTNSCGSAQDTFELLKNDANCCFPNMPNAFTPNGDGTNDKFSPVFKGCTVEFLEMYIYSRWGELVFQGIYPNELWDGKNLNGWDAHSDVYYYVITFKVKGGDLERRNGQLTLIR